LRCCRLPHDDEENRIMSSPLQPKRTPSRHRLVERCGCCAGCCGCWGMLLLLRGAAASSSAVMAATAAAVARLEWRRSNRCTIPIDEIEPYCDNFALRTLPVGTTYTGTGIYRPNGGRWLSKQRTATASTGVRTRAGSLASPVSMRPRLASWIPFGRRPLWQLR
jgi:hypothetical protein